ncbi:MAG: carbohydrate ABC transporter substrate-binding protein [Clostridia bacterium]|nr:carbohydrate ABC transporter substrate-binding protein [Clostridia bacterium]
MILSLFAACNQEREGIEKLKISYGERDNRVTLQLKTAEVYQFQDYPNITDLIVTDSGYQLLSNYDSASTILTLDEEFQIVQREEKEGCYVAICKIGEIQYTLKADNDIYTLYRNDEIEATYEEAGIDEGKLHHFHDGIYVRFHSKLYYGDEEVKLPEPTFGYQYHLTSLFELAEKTYLLANEFPEQDNGMERKIRIFTIEKGRIGAEVQIDSGLIHALGLAEGVNGLYYVTQDKLMCFDGENDTECAVLSNLGIEDGSVQSVIPLKTGEVILWNINSIFLLTGEDEKEEEEAILRVAYSTMDDSVMKEILRFNRLETGTTIELHMISLHTNAMDLSRAILSQDVDVIIFGTQNYSVIREIAKSGLLMPLDQAFSNQFDRNDIFSNLLEVGKVDGELYTLPIQMSLQGFSLPEDVMGNRNGFSSVEEFRNIIDSLSDQRFRKVNTREAALTYAGFYSLRGFEDWVDWETNQCQFVDDDFIALLELMKSYAADEDEALANSSSSNKPLLYRVELGNVLGPMDLEFLYEEKGAERPYSEYAMQGKPFAVPGNGSYKGLSIDSDSMIAVAVNSGNQEAIEAFLNHFFSKETQLKMLEESDLTKDIPVRNDAVEIACKDNGMTEAQKQASLQLITQADNFAIGNDSDIAIVVSEEAMRYFSGEITAEKAAEYIQNRVSLYLAEQS